MSYRRYLAVGVAAFLVILVVNFPAGYVRGTLQEALPGLQLGNLSGSVFSGRSDSASYAGQDLGTVDWRLKPLALLLLVLIPGIGREVNGSQRWLPLGPFTLQPSEFAKLAMVVYLAGYMVRREHEVRNQWQGFLKPMAVLFAATLLLMIEPDFGATVIVVGSAFGMLFLAGVPFLIFSTLALAVVSVFAAAVWFSPERWDRIRAFTDPWHAEFRLNDGYQLTQALMAIGRGEWTGVGLGQSVQKLHYLPEAHTDFLFAVLAEEFGLLGVCIVIALYALLVWRAFVIAAQALQANNPFAAWLAYGLGIWFGLQSFINIGVNMGLLPTKGLTLPLMSYGGSSMLIMCAAVVLLLRVDHETRCTAEGLSASGIAAAKRGRVHR